MWIPEPKEEIGSIMEAGSACKYVVISIQKYHLAFLYLHLFSASIQLAAKA